MNGKPSEPQGKVAPSVQKPIEVAIEELRPLLRPGKEDEAESVLEAYFETHRGPLPPARELVNYELACPGAAERIIKMAESE